MITHVLKDGTVIHDITDHVVKEDDAREAYAVMDKFNDRRRFERRIQEKAERSKH